MKRLDIHTLEKGWCDRDDLLLHACFQILTDFVETEMPGHEPHPDDLDRQKAWDELKALYDWWGNHKDVTGFYGNALEKEKEMLRRLIVVRGYMWT